MGETATMDERRLWNWLRLTGWVGAAVLLMLPLVAMQYTSEVDWALSDFLVAAAMLGTAGLVLELATRRSDSLAYRFGTVIAVAPALLLVWVNGAVGFLGDEGNPANLMFLGVILIAVIGAVIARANPAGMAQAMFATASAQVLAGVIGFAAGWASPGSAGLFEVLVGTSLFTGLWLLAGVLFGKAARPGL